MLFVTVLRIKSHCVSTIICGLAGAFAEMGVDADILTLILILFGANGASIAVAVASPNNTLFTDFIVPHDYLLLQDYLHVICARLNASYLFL
jgi:hypothetical protein